MNPNSLGGTTHQINPAGGYMVVSASTAKFNDWKRITPRKPDQDRGEAGDGEEIGLHMPRGVCSGDVNLVLVTPSNGMVSFDAGGSPQRTLSAQSLEDGYEKFSLFGGVKQSDWPQHVKIQAWCTTDGKMKKEYEFTVCAHPVNFQILYDHCTLVCCDFACLSMTGGELETIGYRVNWWWDSDSGEIEDLTWSSVKEIKTGIEGRHEYSYNANGNEGHTPLCKDLRLTQRYYNSTPYVGHNRAIIDYKSSCTRCGEHDTKIGYTFLWVDLDGNGGGNLGTYHRDSRESGRCLVPKGCQYSWCYERLITCPAGSMETNQCP